MVAYHFPPLAGSSGIQRTLRFVQHLPEHGWEPLVLTTGTLAYERTAADLQAEVPAGTVVRRAFALDTTRHLSIGGHHLGWMSRPDRWTSWRFDGVRTGLKMIEEFRPALIFSTYPIATAHLIALALHRRTGIPWVADFRDPMAQDGYPTDASTWAAFKRIEEDAIRHARLCLFTTPGAVREYRRRYPDAASRIELLENGYDEEAFAAAERLAPAARRPASGPRIILHSGIVYPDERDPRHLFAALRQLHDRGAITPAAVRLRFRAAVHDDLLRALAGEHGVEAYIELCPPVDYVKALREMLDADALLVLQAANCNQQVPAKLYEYVRAARPILGLTDPLGDTATTLTASKAAYLAPLDEPAMIAATLRVLLDTLRSGRACAPDPTLVRDASRRARARRLASLMDRVCASCSSETAAVSPQVQP